MLIALKVHINNFLKKKNKSWVLDKWKINITFEKDGIIGDISDGSDPIRFNAVVDEIIATDLGSSSNYLFRRINKETLVVSLFDSITIRCSEQLLKKFVQPLVEFKLCIELTQKGIFKDNVQ